MGAAAHHRCGPAAVTLRQEAPTYQKILVVFTAHAASQAAVRHHCDLIVVATEGRNAVMRILSGSVLPGLITAATVPVLVGRPQGAARPPGLRSG